MVLSVVLGVALVVTLMLSVLLRMPFAVSRYAHRKADSVVQESVHDGHELVTEHEGDIFQPVNIRVLAVVAGEHPVV